MSQINYDKSVFDLMGELAQMQSSMLIKKDDDSIVVNAVDNSESVFYNFKTKSKSFEFDGEDCYVTNFPEFHRLVNLYEKATVTQDGLDLRIQQGKSKIDYRLTKSSMADDEITEVDFDEDPVKFELSVEDIDNIKKMISSVVNGPDGFAMVNVDGTNMTLSLGSSIHDNVYSEEYDNVINPNDEELELKLGTDIFTIIPRGNYEVSIDPVGLFKFKLIREDASVSIYTGILELDD